MLDLLPPGHVNMLCGSGAEVVSRQFCFLTLSSVFFFSVGIKAGGFEFGCVGCCLAVNESNCLLNSYCYSTVTASVNYVFSSPVLIIDIMYF